MAFIERLAQAMERQQTWPKFPTGIDIDQAYVLQAELSRRVFAGEVAGIKAGVTTKAAQDFLAVDSPLIASLYQGRGIAAGAEIEFCEGVSIECEIGIVVNARGEVISAGPALEFVALPFSNAEDFKVENILLANLAADRYMKGPQSQWRQDYADLELSLYRDGELLNQASVMDAIGGPHRALQWMLAEADRRQMPLGDDFLIMTGSCGDVVPATPGNYLADYGELGQLEFNIR